MLPNQRVGAGPGSGCPSRSPGGRVRRVLAQRAAGHGEENVIERRAGQLNGLEAEPGHVQLPQQARPTLDDVFLTVTGRSLREDAPEAAPPDRVPVA